MRETMRRDGNGKMGMTIAFPSVNIDVNTGMRDYSDLS